MLLICTKYDFVLGLYRYYTLIVLYVPLRTLHSFYQYNFLILILLYYQTENAPIYENPLSLLPVYAIHSPAFDVANQDYF